MSAQQLASASKAVEARGAHVSDSAMPGCLALLHGAVATGNSCSAPAGLALLGVGWGLPT